MSYHIGPSNSSQTIYFKDVGPFVIYQEKPVLDFERKYVGFGGVSIKHFNKPFYKIEDERLEFKTDNDCMMICVNQKQPYNEHVFSIEDRFNLYSMEYDKICFKHNVLYIKLHDTLVFTSFNLANHRAQVQREREEKERVDRAQKELELQKEILVARQKLQTYGVIRSPDIYNKPDEIFEKQCYSRLDKFDLYRYRDKTSKSAAGYAFGLGVTIISGPIGLFGALIGLHQGVKNDNKVNRQIKRVIIAYDGTQSYIRTYCTNETATYLVKNNCGNCLQTYRDMFQHGNTSFSDDLAPCLIRNCPETWNIISDETEQFNPNRQFQVFAKEIIRKSVELIFEDKLFG
jgi:ribosomal protein S10